MNDLERRFIETSELRVVRADGQAPKLRGYAAVFNALSIDFGGWRERIAPGAFSKAIAEDDVRALWNHDPNFVLGRNRSGTLALAEDDRGLLMEVTPPDTTWARDLMMSIERGDVSQQSFAFRVRVGGARWSEEGGTEIRELTDVGLYDVSPVTYPAYPDTSVAVRSLECWRKERTPPPEQVSHDLAIRRLKLIETEIRRGR